MYEPHPLPDMIDYADPHVFWHESSQKWIMITFIWPYEPINFRFLSSTDLKHWTPESTFLHERSECPDLYELALDGDQHNRKWVFNIGNGMYDIGNFDGHKFVPEKGRYQLDYGHFYASLTWNNIPKEDGRTIHIAWMYGPGQDNYPNMPFWDQLTFPCELMLRTCPEGIRVCRQPIHEIAMLYDQVNEWRDITLDPGDNPLSDLSGQLFDIDIEFDLGDALEVGFIIRGFPIRFIIKQKQLCFLDKWMPMTVTENHIHIRLLVDQTSIEIFGNQGQTVLSCCFLPKQEDESYNVYDNDGRAKIVMMKVRSLHSIWK